jgi:23S rRNA (cytidine1920-2'-O)/16S rRNA (cytidine1409-2'-O)-methyltransferase
MSKTRLDLLLLDRVLVESRSKAQALIMAGKVRVDGQVEYKPSTLVNPTAVLSVNVGPRFVSRGGDKLEAALEAFPVQVAGCTCADVGASTGGFTDCLLQHGASRVYAVDVGKGQLHWKLRSDPRVVVMEKTNARWVAALPEPASLVTIDASFISLKLLFPVVKNWLSPIHPGQRPGAPANQGTSGSVIALIKPQFEAGRKEAARNRGVIRDPAVRRAVIVEIISSAQLQGYGVLGLVRSPILGPKGNVEFLMWLAAAGNSHSDLPGLIDSAARD